MEKKLFKGRKLYGISNADGAGNIICVYEDANRVKENLDEDFTVFVEMVVTRVFRKEKPVSEFEGLQELETGV